MEKLFYCDMYCFEVCYVMISCIFYAYVVVFSIRAHCAIQYTLLLAINRLVHPSSTPLLLQPLPHHLYCRMMQQNILCISHVCILYPLSISYPCNPYTANPNQKCDIIRSLHPQLIVAHHILASLTILPRVELFFYHNKFANNE